MGDLDAIDDPCPSCGAPEVGGLAGCRAHFDAILARTFSEPAFGRSRRLLVDAYSLQHPEQFMKSSKSAAAHLAAMCWAQDRGVSESMPAPWVERSGGSHHRPQPSRRSAPAADCTPTARKSNNRGRISRRGLVRWDTSVRLRI